VDIPDTQYARSGDVSVAFQVFGSGPVDLVLIRGSLSDLSSAWEQPLLVDFLRGLGGLARVITFDKRGTGLSDRVREVPTLEARMDDVRAVMDAAGSERALLWAAHEGTRISTLFAATYPERTLGLTMYDPQARGRRGPDYPWARSDEEWRQWLREVADGWGKTEFFESYLREYSPTLAEQEDARAWFVHHMRRSASPGAAVAFQRMQMEGDVSDVLPAVRVPALILYRAKSAGCAGFVAERMPDATMKEIPGLIDGYSWATTESNDFMLAETESFIHSFGEPREPERMLATIVFTDIVGSTERAAALGDQDWKRLLERHQALVRRRLAEFRGTELNTTGDGFFASFDGPGRAIRFAHAAIEDLRGIGLEIRAGVHTGEVEEVGDDIGGIAVHIAARIAAKAADSEVLVSSTVRDLVAGSGLKFADRGESSLKGVPGSWHLLAATSDDAET
jgi:class 3 adenylate cyclase/pimeloyl-ACP methyl ester carboxylesterase